jgi:hypothetical protein
MAIAALNLDPNWHRFSKLLQDAWRQDMVLVLDVVCCEHRFDVDNKLQTTRESILCQLRLQR